MKTHEILNTISIFCYFSAVYLLFNGFVPFAFVSLTTVFICSYVSGLGYGYNKGRSEGFTDGAKYVLDHFKEQAKEE